MIKKRKLRPYLWGGAGVLLASVLLMVGLQGSDNFHDAALKSTKINLSEKEINNKPVLETTSGKNITLDDKKSLHLPFIKNEGQVTEETVEYYAPIFSGTLFVTDQALTYHIENTKTEESIADNFKNEGLVLEQENTEIPESTNLIEEKEALSVEEENDEGLLVQKASNLSESQNELITANSNQFDLSVDSENLENDETISHSIALTETFLDRSGAKIKINPKGENQSQTKTSYFIGNDSKKWQTNVATNDAIHLGEIYNRIDVFLRAYANNVEKLFVVESGGNPAEILVKVDGVNEMTISDKGEIVLTVGEQKVSLTKPVAYQEELSETGESNSFTKKYVNVNYVLHGDDTYGFEVGNYDQNKTLVIDPLLSSTYLGGSLDEMYSYDDFGGRLYNGHKSVVEDSSGNIYVVGVTKSDDYPTTVGVVDETFNDGGSILKNDIVISKFNSDLTQLLSSTYLGGTSEDVGSALIIDNNDVYVTGFTRSGDFPITNGVHDATYSGGNSDIFVAKLSDDLTSLEASTFIGGTNKEFAYSLVKDGSNLYVAGDTHSANFPVRSGAYDSTLGGSNDGFVLQMTDDLTTINSTTFLGGVSADYARHIKKSNGNIIVAGQTDSTDFPGSPGTLQGNTDGYVASLSADLATLNNSTYFGGSQADLVASMEIDSNDNILIVGSTDSTNFVGMTGYNTANNGHFDGFVTKFNSGLTQVAATYLGGTKQDDVYEMGIDSNDNIYLVGQTYSSNYPITQYAWDDTMDGNSEGFISKLSNDLTTLEASTYFGGAGNSDYILSIFIDDNAEEDIVIKGLTDSSDLPTTSGAYDESLNSGRDIFVSRLTSDLRQNAWPDHVEVKYENPTDTFNTSVNTLAGETKTLTIFLKDPSGNTVTEDSYDGDYATVFSGVADSPHGHNPTCKNKDGSLINFGSNTILTFTDGVATCDAVFYGAEIASIDAQVTISATPYDSTGNADYDLDVTVDHNVMSEVGSSIDAVVNPTIIEDNVNITVTVNDEWGNSLGTDGISQTIVINVTGENTATPTVTDEGDGTYTAGYTTGTSAGTDNITATLNTNALQYDEDGTSDGTFELPLYSQAIHHLALRYENPVDTYNDSLAATAGDSYTLAIIAEDQYGNPVNDYDGYHYITVTGANNSPYGDIPFCGTNSSQKLGQSNRYTFNDGIAKCNLMLYNAESVQLEGTDGTYNTTGSDAYDLYVKVANTTHDHMKITDSRDANDITATAGITTGIKVSARDVYGNFIATYDGDHDIIFSGMSLSFNGTISTVEDKISSPINVETATTLNFTNGEVTTDMELYTRENVEIEVADDTAHDSTGNVEYDLNVIISSQGLINATESTIGVSQDPAGTCGEEGVFVIARDDYGNQLESGGDTVVVTIAGTNAGMSPLSVIDNGNGSYSASYSPAAGADQIEGTINTVAIGKDFDGNSDGIYNLTITSGGNTLHWDGSDSADWHTAANWAEGVVPSACSTVIIDGDIDNLQGSSLPYYEPVLDLSGGSEGIANLYIGRNTELNATPTTLEISYGSETNKLTTTGNIVIGDTVADSENGKLTHTANNATQDHVLNLEVGGNLTIDVGGEIDLQGKGYASGNGPGYDPVRRIAAHGGYGGFCSAGDCYHDNYETMPYGSITEPSTIGSSGKVGSGSYIYTQSAGGAVKVVATGNIIINGNILANTTTKSGGSGASGGSVWLDGDVISGSAKILAESGDSINFPTVGSYGISGGGGRIAIYYNTLTLSENNIATQHKNSWGGAGTIYLKDKVETYGDLIVDNNADAIEYVNPWRKGNIYERAMTPQFTSQMDPANKEMTYRSIRISDYAKYEVPAGATLNILDTTTLQGEQEAELWNDGTVNFKAESGGSPLDTYTLDSFTFVQNVKDGILSGLGTSLTVDGAGFATAYTGETSDENILNMGNITVQNGGILTHPRNYVDAKHSLSLNLSGDLNVDATSKIDLEGRGHTAGGGLGYAGTAAGAAHGGYGYYRSGQGQVYGSITNPSYLGSGGSFGNYGASAWGGGSVNITANNMTLDGDIASIQRNNERFGSPSGGSGGSILLNTNNLSGGGSIISSGGMCAGGHSVYRGGGGGGRIALYFNDNSGFTGNLSTASTVFGTYDDECGGVGTIYLKDKDNASDEGTLIVDNKGFDDAETTPQYADLMDISNQEMTYSHIEIGGNAEYVIESNNILNILSSTTNSGDKTGYLTNYGTVNFPDDYELSDTFTFNQDVKDGIITGLNTELRINNSGLATFNTTGDGGELSFYALNIPGNLIATNTSVLTHKENTTIQEHTLNLEVGGDFSLDSTSQIDVNEKGYSSRNGPCATPTTSGNACYGGWGRTQYSDHEPYGSIIDPLDLGSGGYAYAGGGAVNVVADGDVVIDGEVLSYSRDTLSYNGSGGSILFEGNTVQGIGTLKASGRCYSNSGGYSTGGGRIALKFIDDTNLFSGTIQTVNKDLGNYCAGAGTVYFENKTTGWNKLLIDRDNSLETNGYTTTPQHTDSMPSEFQEMTYSEIEIKNAGKYYIDSDDTLNLPIAINILGDETGQLINDGLVNFAENTSTINSAFSIYNNTGTLQGATSLTLNDTDLYQNFNASLGVLEELTIGNGTTVELQEYNLTTPLELNSITINSGGLLTHPANVDTQEHVLNLLVNDLTVNSGGEINVEGKGYAIANGPGAGTGESGGGYGGVGGVGTNGVPGISYGSETIPVDLGSGAGSVGIGGGLVRAQVNNILTIDGNVSANGTKGAYHGGGGAGGTVLFTTDQFEGAGFISADGGNALTCNAGCEEGDVGCESCSYPSYGGGGGGGRIAIYYQDSNIIGDHFLLPGNGSITHLDSNPISMFANEPLGGLSGSRAGTFDGSLGTLYLGFPDHYEIDGSASQEAGTTQTINVTLADNNGNPFIITDDKNLVFSGANVSENGIAPTIEDKNNNSIAFGNSTSLMLSDGVVATDMTLYKAEDAEIETNDGFLDTFGDQAHDLDVNVFASVFNPDETTIDTVQNPVQAGNNVDVVVTPKDAYANQITTTGSSVLLEVGGANTFAGLTTTEVVDGVTGFVTYITDYLASNTGEDAIIGTIDLANIIQDEDGTSDGVYHQLATGDSADHLEITGNSSQTAGSPQTITITAKNSTGEVDLAYSGLKSVTITGAINAPDGTNPTARDDNGVDIAMTESPLLTTTLDFVNGMATSQMYLYKEETAEIEATDGIINTFGSQDYDLDVTVNNSGIDYTQSVLEVYQTSVEPNDEVPITVITYDQFQNPLSVGGETVIASVAGANMAGSITLDDNGDGTYSTTTSPLTHHVPTSEGEDLITALVAGNAVEHDNDGTDDGTYHLTVVVLPRHIEITGTGTQIAGTTQVLTLIVKDSLGVIDTDYDGNKTITFSGASVSGLGDAPTTDAVDFGSTTMLNFTDGESTGTLALFTAETAEIEATDGAIDTTGDQAYDLDVVVSATDSCLGTLSANPNPVWEDNQVDITLDEVKDQYGNPILTGGDSPDFAITGVNPTTLVITDNGNGTYSAYYTPTDFGIDTVAGTLGVCTLTPENIVVVDDTSPTPSLSLAVGQSNPTDFPEGSFVISFDEPIDGTTLTEDDFSVTGVMALQGDPVEIGPFDGTTFAFSGSGMVANQTVTLMLPAGKIEDLSGNINNTSNSVLLTYNTDPTPVLALAPGQVDPTAVGEGNFVVTFDEPINGATITEDDFDITGTITLQGDPVEIGPFDGTTFAFSGSGMVANTTVTLSLPAGTVEDLAGNLNFESNQITLTYDTAPTPVLSLAAGQANPTDINEGNFVITFDEPINPTTLDISDFAKTGIINLSNLAEIGPFDGTTFSFTGSNMMANTTITISLPAGSVADLAGNLSVESNQISLTYNPVPPTPVLEDTTQSNTTSVNEGTFTIVFDKPIDPTSLTKDDFVVTGTITLQGDPVEIGPFDGTTFTFSGSGMVANEIVTLSLPAGTILDLEGNPNLESNAIILTFNTDPTPVLSLALGQANPTGVDEGNFVVTFDEPINTATLTKEDLDITGALTLLSDPVEIGPFDGTTFAFSGEGMMANTTVTLILPAGTVEDLAGNLNFVSNQISLTYDTEPTPVLSLASTQPNPTSESDGSFRIMFEEPINVATLTKDDFDITGAITLQGDPVEIGPFDGTTFAFSGSGMVANTTVTLSLPAGKVADLAGNLNLESNVISLTYNTDPMPVLALAPGQDNPTDINEGNFVITFDEPIYAPTFTKDDFDITGAITLQGDPVEIGPFDGTTFAFSGSGMVANTTVTLRLPANTVEDLYGNLNLASNEISLTYNSSVVVTALQPILT